MRCSPGITSASGAERRTFWGCFGGWALDAMDVQLYSLVIPTLIAAWGITKTQAGLLATSALLLSAVGGWIAGLLSDRIGRVRTLQITILWFAFFTFVSGFAQNFEQLLVARALMGLGFGGEWAAGAVLMGEVIRAEHRGKAVGTVQSGWAVGWGCRRAALCRCCSAGCRRRPPGARCSSRASCRPGSSCSSAISSTSRPCSRRHRSRSRRVRSGRTSSPSSSRS